MPSKGRRGTKSNPFDLGERVRLKGSPLGTEGEVVGVEPRDYGGHIAYFVKVGGYTRRKYAKELEAVEV
jgi:hypothetical protein